MKGPFETPEAVGRALRRARTRLLSMVEDLTDGQLAVPPSPILNPFLWELGHVAWFAERFLLRRGAEDPSLRADADRHWDSIAVAHQTRWDLDLPSRRATLDYMQAVLDQSLERMERLVWSPAERDRHLLVLAHEEQHVEAFAYMRQTLAYPPPPGARLQAEGHSPHQGGEACFPKGTYTIGCDPGEEFVFDNEVPAHGCRLRPFALSCTAVTEYQFRDFVEEGGYRRRDLWSEAGRRWLERSRATHPCRWRAEAGSWLRQDWNRWEPLQERRPVCHVNAFEAEAWCRWAGRRLPTEAEWEVAARTCPPPVARGALQNANFDFALGDLVSVDAFPGGASSGGAIQLHGNLWEWTSTDFHPYPGFRIGLYREYSQPWFHDHRVLRGGSWASGAILVRPSLRNFYRPQRADPWCGFRAARDLGE